MALDAETLRAYRQRWQMVAQITESERKHETVAEHWQQLNSLMQMSAALGLLVAANESEATEPDQHWNQLRQIFLSGQQGDAA